MLILENDMILEKVISGAQTGADVAGLFAAKKYGLATGGFCPKGCRTTVGNKISWIDYFDLTETESDKYPPRTFANAKAADGTVRFALKFNSSGEKLTLKAIKKYDKPYFDVNIQDMKPPVVLAKWILDNEIKVLNVAGNSEKTVPGISEIVYHYLGLVFENLRELCDA